MPLRAGLSACATMSVTDRDTAVALRSGDVDVLANSRLVGLAEEAAVQAVQSELAEGTTTVGYRVQLDHLAPIPVGGAVRAEATLESIESRRLVFRIAVFDAHGLVAAGKVTRVVVDRDRFLEKAAGQ